MHDAEVEQDEASPQQPPDSYHGGRSDKSLLSLYADHMARCILKRNV